MSPESLPKDGLIDLQGDMGRWMWSFSEQSYKQNNLPLSECYLIEFGSLFVLFSPPPPAFVDDHSNLYFYCPLLFNVEVTKEIWFYECHRGRRRTET